MEHGVIIAFKHTPVAPKDGIHEILLGCAAAFRNFAYPQEAEPFVLV